MVMPCVYILYSCSFPAMWSLLLISHKIVQKYIAYATTCLWCGCYSVHTPGQLQRSDHNIMWPMPMQWLCCQFKQANRDLMHTTQIRATGADLLTIRCLTVGPIWPHVQSENERWRPREKTKAIHSKPQYLNPPLEGSRGHILLTKHNIGLWVKNIAL